MIDAPPRGPIVADAVVVMAGVSRSDRPSPEERAAQLEADDRVFRREQRRDLVVFVASCVLAVVAGFTGMGIGVAIADRVWGPIIFWSGYVLGCVIWLAGMIYSWQRARERGDV